MLAGVIRNPKSQRNKTQPLTEVRLPAGVRLATPDTPEALAEVLCSFAAEGIRHLMIDGGDGTLRDVLSALPAAYGTDWPSIALCASGNTNLAAADVGSFARDQDAVPRWLATLNGIAPKRSSLRQPIQVSWPDGSRAPVFGFFVGCANYTRGVAMATSTLRDRGWFHGWAVAGTLIGAAWQVLTGAADSEWQRGSPLSLAVDQAQPVTAPRFVLLVTSLNRLMLGLWPFWFQEQAATAPLRWLDIRAPAPRIGLALPALLRGKPKPWMLASDAYHSGCATQLQLSLNEPLIIDGEAFAPSANGELLLTAGPALRFYAPA